MKEGIIIKQKSLTAEPNPILKEVFSWVKVILLAVALTFFINYGLIVNARIPTASMESTIMTGDKIIALRTAYLFDTPDRGDIVVFKFPDNEKELYIKRVIGLPNETVEIKDGKVYINDSDIPLEENYLNEIPYGDFGPYEVPEDSYFMLGDNRNISADSRYWNNTYVKKDKILGKALLTYYPHIEMLH